MVDYLDDIESDLSAIHPIEDPWALPARRFFLLAERLMAYPGVMQLRARAELDKAEPEPDVANAELSFEAAVASKAFQGDGGEFPPVFSPL
jgi:hypothetical protein